VRLSPLNTAATSDLLHQPQMIYDGDCGAIGGMKISRGNRSTRIKPAPAPLYPPQIPHDQTRARTRAAAVGSKRLTAWVMALPPCSCDFGTICRWACQVHSPIHFAPRQTSGSHCPGSWIDVRAGLDAVWIETNAYPWREYNLEPPVVMRAEYAAYIETVVRN
jgi:hypothetical protein